jgi:hypothetical protein
MFFQNQCKNKQFSYLGFVPLGIIESKAMKLIQGHFVGHAFIRPRFGLHVSVFVRKGFRLNEFAFYR